MCMFPKRRLRAGVAAITGMIICIGVMDIAIAQSKASQSIASQYTGIGRTATPAEIKAWDIDVRPDFKGLPPGAGSVAKGQQIWEAQCESCHGAFGESNEVFTPMTGGTTHNDQLAGRVATLTRADFPQRTTLMKLSQLSTLWDYINRAMPWNAPKSLTTNEVYAVTAYILNLGDIVAADFVLSDKNIREVQATLPNRNGVVKFEPLWNIKGKGDVRNTLCMTDCNTDSRTISSLPDFARNAHGNLAEQNRLIGPVRGTNTATAGSNSGAVVKVAAAIATTYDAQDLAKKYACVACHASHSKQIGPSYKDISAKYNGDPGASAKLATKIRSGGAGVWGTTPMPAQRAISNEDLQALAQWSLSGGP